MLERGETLMTWRISRTSFQEPQAAVRIADHRKAYLDFEGEIAGGRGRVKIWDAGTYELEEERPDLIRIAISGRQINTRLVLRRAAPSPETPDPLWTVADAATDLRKAVASLLRAEGIEEAPTEDLSALRDELLGQERRILAQANLFARGAPVDWTQAEVDADLMRRIDREKARWQHPWLAKVKQYADRLAELAALLDRQRPS